MLYMKTSVINCQIQFGRFYTRQAYNSDAVKDPLDLAPQLREVHGSNTLPHAVFRVHSRYRPPANSPGFDERREFPRPPSANPDADLDERRELPPLLATLS